MDNEFFVFYFYLLHLLNIDISIWEVGLLEFRFEITKNKNLFFETCAQELFLT